MAEDTIQLLRDCQLSVYKPNPRQYVASIPQLPGVEVWFQRASDVVRKLSYGDVDLGIVGYDMFAEISGAGMVDGELGKDAGIVHGDLVILHDALGFGGCHLGLGVPTGGRFAGVDTLDQLLSMPDWTPETPLRVVTGYQNVARAFFEAKGFSHKVALLGADGALEAAPLMGCADIILDLVSTGVTLRENNLKEIEGGKVLESQGVLVANRRALLGEGGGRLLDIVHELIERLEAHLKADKYYSVVANMRGATSRAVADRILACDGLRGLEGPTVSPVFAPREGAGGKGGAAPAPSPSSSSPAEGDEGTDGLWAAVICVPKRRLYDCVKELRSIGGSGVLVQPMTYIFDEEPARWRALLEALGKGDFVPGSGGGGSGGASPVSHKATAASAA